MKTKFLNTIIFGVLIILGYSFYSCNKDIESSPNEDIHLIPKSTKVYYFYSLYDSTKYSKMTVTYFDNDKRVTVKTEDVLVPDNAEYHTIIDDSTLIKNDTVFFPNPSAGKQYWYISFNPDEDFCLKMNNDFYWSLNCNCIWEGECYMDWYVMSGGHMEWDCHPDMFNPCNDCCEVTVEVHEGSCDPTPYKSLIAINADIITYAGHTYYK